jgi:putative ABC transport system permease protein
LILKLAPHDIDFIRYNLRKRGVADAALFDDLVDHICCEVEREMNSGISFKKAVEKVLSQLEPDELSMLQDDAIQSQNYKTTLMLRNTLKMMRRNLAKHGTHSVINVAGLALGLTCFIIIGLYVRHEVGFDSMFAHSPSIYRVTMSSTVGGNDNHIPTVYPAIGPEIETRFGDVKKYARVINYKYSRLVPTFRYNENIFYEDNVIFADSTFFEIFDFPFLSGNPATALEHPGSVVLTEKMAKKYFGDDDALGKHLNFNNRGDLVVTGVLMDLPSKTHMQFDFVIPMSNYNTSPNFKVSSLTNDWRTDWYWTYMIIPNETAVAKIEAGINALAEEKAAESKKEYDLKFFIQPLTDIHLHSAFDYNTDISQNGDITNLYIFISVGILVLLISAINFVNITMATATRRYKEIGVNKVLGALKSQLRVQFLFESVTVCLASLAIAFAIMPLMLPLFSGLLGVSLEINVDRDAILIIMIVLFAVAIGLLAGLYPAFFVSSLEPQRVLKGVWKPGQGGTDFRKSLVGIQIAISIFLLIATVVIWEQLTFVRNKSLGYDKEQIVMLTIRGTSLVKSFHTLKNKLLNESSITQVSSVSEPIGREVQFMSFKVEGEETPQFIKILNVTHDFVKTMGLQIVDGRDFSREVITDSISGFIINEAAARSLGWSNPVGKEFNHAFFRQTNQGRVIGVVKDFNFEPLQKQIDPIVIWFGGPFWYAAVRVEKGKSAEALAAMEREWKILEPEKPFSFHFLDESIQHVYEKEQRLSNVFAVFAVISIFTAVLGLFGLISFVAEQRLAEIGIRKVMGASVQSILYLMSKEYIVLVLCAFVFAGPLTYLTMNNWLQTFAFRISWSPLYFVAGLMMCGSIVVATVVLKAMRAAKTNPADILRME